MDGQLEYQIRMRAYAIWERECTGDPVRHWLQAERELARQAQEPMSVAADSLPDHWQAAIDSTLQKLTRKARVHAERLRRATIHRPASA